MVWNSGLKRLNECHKANIFLLCLILNAWRLKSKALTMGGPILLFLRFSLFLFPPFLLTLISYHNSTLLTKHTLDYSVSVCALLKISFYDYPSPTHPINTPTSMKPSWILSHSPEFITLFVRSHNISPLPLKHWAHVMAILFRKCLTPQLDGTRIGY